MSPHHPTRNNKELQDRHFELERLFHCSALGTFNFLFLYWTWIYIFRFLFNLFLLICFYIIPVSCSLFPDHPFSPTFFIKFSIDRMILRPCSLEVSEGLKRSSCNYASQRNYRDTHVGKC